MKKQGIHTLPQIALLLESSNEVCRAILRGIMKYVRVYGPWALQLDSGGPTELRVPDLHSWHGDGIIARAPSERIITAIASARLPTVLINPPSAVFAPEHPLASVCRVQGDSDAVGRMAAEYYLSNDFPHFAFVGSLQRFNWSDWRRDAFCGRLAKEGQACAIYPRPSICLPWEKERALMRRWLKNLSKPVALFAANDLRGRQVLNACLDADIAVPHEIAVLAVDNDTMVCETSQPPLSSIAMDAEKAGYGAAELLDQLLHGKKVIGRCLRYPPVQIVERESSLHATLHDHLVIRALELIRVNAGLNLRVAEIAGALKVTPCWLEKRFRVATGHSIKQEIDRARLETIHRLVTETKMPFLDIAKRCGFNGPNHLGVLFKKAFGCTMTTARGH